MRSFARARYLLQSNFGRNDGWFIELEGLIVGELSDPHWEDQFWHSYAVTAGAGAAREIVLEDALWKDSRFTFCSRRTAETVATAFCGGGPPFVRGGRVWMRRLYLLPSSLPERLWLYVLDPLLRKP